MSEYPRIRVEGGPRERGQQYGEQARERVQRSVEGYGELFARIAELSWPEVTTRARSFERPIASYGGSYLAELRGIADGAGLTNHFLAPGFDGTDVSLWSMPDSPFRLERLRARVGSRPVSVELLQDAFRDHANEPNGVCCHPDPRSPAVEQGLTAASIVMELDNRALWLADGPPCSAPYERLDYGTFLSKQSPVRRAPQLSS